MIGPKIEEIEEIAVANSSGYPDFFIAGIVMPPMAEAVATPEPEIAPNSVEDKTVTTPKLPLICPINAFAMLISFSVILRDIRLPAKIKKGIASKELEFMPAKSFCGNTISAISAIWSATRVPIPKAIKMGTPRKDKTSKKMITTTPTFILLSLLYESP